MRDKDKTEEQPLLREMNPHSQPFLDTIPDIVYFKDVQGRNQIVNRAFEEFVGLKRGEIIGKTDEHVFPPDLARQCSNSDREVLKGGRTLHFEEEYTGRDGKEIFFHTIKSPVYDHQGNLVGLIGVSRNITEYRQSLEDLHLFNTLINQSSDIISIVDPETGSFLYVNDRACSSTGYSREEFLNMRVTDVEASIPDNLSWERSVEEIKRKGYMLIEGIAKRKDGTTFPEEVNIRFVSLGESNYIVAVVRDVTERKKMEDSLKEREAQLKAVIRSFDGLLYVCSSDYRIEFMNERHIEYVGYDASGELCYKAMRGFNSTCPWCVNERVFKGETLRREAKGKDNRWYYVIHAPIFNADGSVSALMMGVDITEQKKMKEEASSIQAKLIHTNKIQSLGVLASGITHEINNPNNFIMTNASMLYDICSDAIKIMTEYHNEKGDFFLGGIPFTEIRDYLPRLISGITEGSQRIKNIVDNLKEFYRNDGRMDERVNINDVINASLLILTNKIRNYTREFHLSLKNDIPNFKGSFQQIEQVIINLLMNAMEAIPDKKGGISVSTSCDGDNDYVMAKIKDEGIGMPRDVIERITEPFFTTKLDRGGTGLGLYISRSIIEEHGGSLKFESEPDKGTTAIVILPAYKET